MPQTYYQCIIYIHIHTQVCVSVYGTHVHAYNVRSRLTSKHHHHHHRDAEITFVTGIRGLRGGIKYPKTRDDDVIQLLTYFSYDRRQRSEIMLFIAIGSTPMTIRITFPREMTNPSILCSTFLLKFYRE